MRGHRALSGGLVGGVYVPGMPSPPNPVTGLKMGDAEILRSFEPCMEAKTVVLNSRLGSVCISEPVPVTTIMAVRYLAQCPVIWLTQMGHYSHTPSTSRYRRARNDGAREEIGPDPHFQEQPRRNVHHKWHPPPHECPLRRYCGSKPTRHSE